MTEPMKALNMVLKAAADGESSHDIITGFDRCFREIARNDSIEMQMPRAYVRGTTISCIKLFVRMLGTYDYIGD